jgi:hypothetical protein
LPITDGSVADVEMMHMLHNLWWRQRTGDALKNKEAMRALVKDGGQPGLLAHENGGPVVWLSVGAREQFGQLMRSPQYKPRDVDANVFTISVLLRRSAVETIWCRQCRDYAIEWARWRGATAAEAYPNVNPDFMGSLEAFERRGFSPTRTAGKRVVVRLAF